MLYACYQVSAADVNILIINGSLAGTVNYLKKLQEITTIYMLQEVTHHICF